MMVVVIDIFFQLKIFFNAICCVDSIKICDTLSLALGIRRPIPMMRNEWMNQGKREQTGRIIKNMFHCYIPENGNVRKKMPQQPYCSSKVFLNTKRTKKKNQFPRDHRRELKYSSSSSVVIRESNDDLCVDSAVSRGQKMSMTSSSLTFALSKVNNWKKHFHREDCADVDDDHDDNMLLMNLVDGSFG